MDLRCFVAIELPDGLKNNIYDACARLWRCGADVRWVPSENLHLTLKFLGDTPEGRIPSITELLDEAASSHMGFRLTLKGLGAFPGLKRPRVVWIGVYDSEGLLELKLEVEEKMQELGFEPEDRRFSPHLTLGRVRSQRGQTSLAKEIESMGDMLFGDFDVHALSLVRSELGPKGARYTGLHSAALRKRAS